MWHDNEKFIQAPKEYKKAGLVSVNFPPNSGDLAPIETVWAELRKDLAIREFEDLIFKRQILDVAHDFHLMNHLIGILKVARDTIQQWHKKQEFGAVIIVNNINIYGNTNVHV